MSPKEKELTELLHAIAAENLSPEEYDEIAALHEQRRDEYETQRSRAEEYRDQDHGLAAAYRQSAKDARAERDAQPHYLDHACRPPMTNADHAAEEMETPAMQLPDALREELTEALKEALKKLALGDARFTTATVRESTEQEDTFQRIAFALSYGATRVYSCELTAYAEQWLAARFEDSYQMSQWFKVEIREPYLTTRTL